jgi:hypothetical protein
VGDTFKRLNLSEIDWEPFDPKGRLAGPREYPDYLTGLVAWLRTYQDVPVPLEDGNMRLAVMAMRGDPTDWYSREKAETEIIILLEGEAQIDIEGEIIEVKGPELIVCLPGHRDRWRYTTPYYGLYAIVW